MPMRTALLSALLLLSPARSLATEFEGYSFYSALNPSVNTPDADGISTCDKFLAAESEFKNPATAILLWDFGSDLRCLHRFFEMFDGRSSFVEFHLGNGSGRRNNRLSDGALLPAYS